MFIYIIYIELIVDDVRFTSGNLPVKKPKKKKTSRSLLKKLDTVKKK